MKILLMKTHGLLKLLMRLGVGQYVHNKLAVIQSVPKIMESLGMQAVALQPLVQLVRGPSGMRVFFDRR